MSVPVAFTGRGQSCSVVVIAPSGNRKAIWSGVAAGAAVVLIAPAGIAHLRWHHEPCPSPVGNPLPSSGGGRFATAAGGPSPGNRIMQRRVWATAGGLLLATAATWLVVGVAAALSTTLWWIIAAVPMLGLLFAPFSLARFSGGRTWPSWVAFPFTLALMLTAYAVPGDWYLREADTRVTATVQDASCMQTKEGRCLYAYTLTGPEGVELPGDFRDTAQYPAGSAVDVVTDPRLPRPAARRGPADPRVRDRGAGGVRRFRRGDRRRRPGRAPALAPPAKQPRRRKNPATA